MKKRHVPKRLNVSDSSDRRAVEDLLAAGHLMMRKHPGSLHIALTHHRWRAVSVEPVSIEEGPCDPPEDEELSNGTYSSISPYRWEP